MTWPDVKPSMHQPITRSEIKYSPHQEPMPETKSQQPINDTKPLPNQPIINQSSPNQPITKPEIKSEPLSGQNFPQNFPFSKSSPVGSVIQRSSPDAFQNVFQNAAPHNVPYPGMGGHPTSGGLGGPLSTPGGFFPAAMGLAFPRQPTGFPPVDGVQCSDLMRSLAAKYNNSINE